MIASVCLSFALGVVLIAIAVAMLVLTKIRRTKKFVVRRYLQNNSEFLDTYTIILA